MNALLQISEIDARGRASRRQATRMPTWVWVGKYAASFVDVFVVAADDLLCRTKG